jgi:hypothetical protein
VLDWRRQVAIPGGMISATRCWIAPKAGNSVPSVHSLGDLPETEMNLPFSGGPGGKQAENALFDHPILDKTEPLRKTM